MEKKYTFANRLFNYASKVEKNLSHIIMNRKGKEKEKEKHIYFSYMFTSTLSLISVLSYPLKIPKLIPFAASFGFMVEEKIIFDPLFIRVLHKIISRVIAVLLRTIYQRVPLFTSSPPSSKYTKKGH